LFSQSIFSRLRFIPIRQAAAAFGHRARASSLLFIYP